MKLLSVANRLVYLGQKGQGLGGRWSKIVPPLQHYTKSSALSTSAESALLDRTVTTNRLDDLHRDLQEVTSGDDVSAKQLVKFAKKLHLEVYDSLSVYPWFQRDNYEVGYIQLLLNSSLVTLNSKFNDHPYYNELYSRVLKNIDHFNSGEAASVAIAYLAVGLPLEDELILRALKVCESKLNETSIEDLSTVSTFTRMMGRNGLFMSCHVTRRAASIMDETPACCDLLDPLLNTYNSIQLFASGSLSDKFQDKFIKILQPHSCLLKDGKTMGSVLRGIRRFPLNKSEEHFQFRNSISSLVLNTLRNEMDFSQLSHSHIGELCNHLQSSRLYYRDLAERFQERALEVIRTSDRICEISNAMYAFHTKWISRDSRRIIDSQVFKHMPDADILILSNLADTLKNMNCRNSDVLDNFHQMILDNSDSLFIYITRLEKVVRHLSWSNFRSRDREDHFMNILLSKLSNTQLGLATWCLTTVACYLLRNTRYTIEPVLYDKLLRIIPQCKVRDLYPILVAMNSAQQFVTPSAANQLYGLQTMIYENVAERMDSIDSQDLLSQIITELLSKSPNPDINILERLMKLYPKFSKRLTKPQYHKIVMVHIHLKFYSVSVFEDLCEFLLKRSERPNDVNSHDLMKLMTLFNAVGYTPKRIVELRDLLLNFYDVHASLMEVDEVVSYVQMLAGMQIFPEDIISEVFNMEFIQRVDKFLEANPEKRQHVEFTMMKLNRMVVIECPELDIPWFHDKYCQQNIVTEYKPENLTFTNKVSGSLSLMFGGSQHHHRTWVYSPYYHHINFEVLLDESGKAIDITKPVSKQPEIGQKVAIRCLVESNFCYNDDELNGFEKIKRRHLELLGYKVVEIPYFEWNSMGLADEQSKTTYLRNKIFS